MDFNYAGELLKLCEETKLPISEVMKRREMDFSSMTAQEVEEKMRKSLEIMKTAAKSLWKMKNRRWEDSSEEKRNYYFHKRKRERYLWRCRVKSNYLCDGSFRSKCLNGCDCCSTDGRFSRSHSGVFLALKEEKALSDEILLKGLYTAGAVGYLIMRNASVAGAEAGCQAEVGAASAMAAAGVVEMFGGTPKQCLDAGSLALSNLLGLVCDPIAGLVEAPCQNRNSIGAANALICAQQALAGLKALIPFDEMVEAMYHVGRSLPFELRESALGGCAGTKTGCQKTCEIFRKNE